MKITREDVLRVAELANLELSEAEVDTYLPQLDSILTYIEKLNELDTTGVEPMTGGCVAHGGSPSIVTSKDNAEARSALRGAEEECVAHPSTALRAGGGKGPTEVGSQNPALREDIPRVAGVAEAALRVAPDPKAPYFRVPKVIER